MRINRKILLQTAIAAIFGLGLVYLQKQISGPGNAVILPDVISKEPLGPVTRADDFAWFNIVKWVNFALVNAEELGITSRNVAEAM